MSREHGSEGAGRSQRVGASVHAGAPSEPHGGPGIGPDAFRDALARWATGVAIVAVRDEGRVVATTVTSLMSVAVEPPLVALAVGPTAQVLPFLAPGARFGVSILGAEQRRLATIFADAYPVGESPFGDDAEPLIPDAPVGLVCRVERADPAGDHEIVLALIESARLGRDEPLVRHQRAYRTLAP